ncbi:hypothetical protein CPB84DRAFT_1772570 [Gymnopilus junonius]|uniref:Uncharacterized protein n=1 Tax=Gymnopilus junonius TaxID=109634 RepID=A0A9P5NS25_GYMJU|nr:hypothetical protein CPB84DRAFT_1772570 [Gymnopilus junonius]
MCITLALAITIENITSWRREIIPTIQDPQHAPFITKNYTTIPAIHLAISLIIVSCGTFASLKVTNAITSIAIAIAFTIYLTDVIMMPIFFLLVLPSPKFEGCLYWFTKPGGISNDQAARGCNLLTGALYKETITGLCTSAVFLFTLIILLSNNSRLIVYSSLPRVPQTHFRTDATFHARAEPNQASITTSINKDIEKQDTIQPAGALETPTIMTKSNQPSGKGDLDDTIQDGAG